MSRSRVCPTDLLTIGNGICGFAALATLANAWLHAGPGGHGLDHDELITVLALYGAGNVLDVLDGPVARWRGSSGLGGVLDTICDTISFGLLPAMLVLVLVGGHAQWRAPAAVAAAVFVGATILRLARNFERETEAAAAGANAGPPSEPEGPGRRQAFAGMPAPAAGNCVLALVILAPAPALVVATVVVVAALMVGDFPYPNTDGFAGIYVAAMFVIGFGAIIGLLSLDVFAVGTLIGVLPLALARVLMQWARPLGWTRSLPGRRSLRRTE